MAPPPDSSAATTPPRRQVALALLQLGLVLAMAHVTVALEIGATLSRHGALVKSLVLLLYPVAVAFLGFGAALDRIVLRSDDPVPPLRGGALCLLLFLPITLRLNFLSSDPGHQALAAAAHGIVLAGWFLFAGVALARLLRQAHLAGAAAVGGLWAAHQVGLVVGYLVQDPLLPVVGVNALHLVVALSLLLPARLALPGLALGLGLAAVLPLDQRIEAHRDTAAVFEEAYQERQAVRLLELLRAKGELVPRHQAWSRLGQFLFIEVDPDTGHLAGWYNFQPQWDLHDPRDEGLEAFRDLVYSRLPHQGRVAILGVGGGRGLLSLPAPTKDYVAIERDPAVVHYFTEVRPEDNRGIFLALTTVASDGRQYLERQAEPFDVIVFESARYQPASALLPASAPYHLYTREALQAVVDHLAPDGWFLAGFTGVRPKPGLEFLPLQVSRTLEELGMTVRTVSTLRGSHVHVAAARDPAVVETVLAGHAADVVPWQPASADLPLHDYRLTDRHPFASWGTMHSDDRSRLLGVAGGVALGCTLLAGGLLVTGRRRHAWNPVPYFFTIGVAQAVLAVATCYLWRTYFTDDVLTVVRVLVYLTAWGALGSAAAPRLGLHRLPWPARALLAGGLVALHFAHCSLAPFGLDAALPRELAGILLLAPGGFSMGTFFPLGVASTARRDIGRLLLADALGALAGYVVLYLVALPFGLLAFSAVAVTAYALAGALWRPNAGRDILAT